MIPLVIICIAAGYIVGISVNAKTHKRHFVNYNNDLRRLALEACVNWQAKNRNECATGSQDGWYDALQARTNVAHSMLKLSKYLGLKNETEKQTFN